MMGDLPASGSVALSVELAADSVETYLFGEESRIENLEARWYLSGGDLEASRAGVMDTVSWTLPSGGDAAAWVVVTDGRGGMGYGALEGAQ